MNEKLIPDQKVSFDEVFPSLENVNIEVTCLNSSGHKDQSITFSKDNFPTSGISCTNPICRHGGLPQTTIPVLIKSMISNSKTEIEEHRFCNGGRFRGKTRYDDCGYSFKIKIKLQLK